MEKNLKRTFENSPQFYARLAGFLYLIVIIGGMFAQAFVRQGLIVSGDAVATAQNILNHARLYRFGFAESIIYLAANMPLTLIFYYFFKRVNRGAALLLVLFVILGTAIESVNLLLHFAPLVFLANQTYLNTFNTAQLQTMAYASLQIFTVGFEMVLAYFSFYCLVTGYLIYKSTFLPRTIGVLMVIAGLSYFIGGFASFLTPGFASHLFPAILIPSFIGETSFCLWLIFKGINVSKWKELISASSQSV